MDDEQTRDHRHESENPGGENQFDGLTFDEDQLDQSQLGDEKNTLFVSNESPQLPAGSTGSGNPAPKKRTKLENMPTQQLTSKQQQAKKYGPKRQTKDMSNRLRENLNLLEDADTKPGSIEYYSGDSDFVLSHELNEANDILWALCRSAHANTPNLVNQITQLNQQELVKHNGIEVGDGFVDTVKQLAIDFGVAERSKRKKKARVSSGADREEEDDDRSYESTDDEFMKRTREDIRDLDIFEDEFALDQRVPKCIRLPAYNQMRDEVADKVRLEFMRFVKSFDDVWDEKERLKAEAAKWHRLSPNYELVSTTNEGEMCEDTGTQTRISSQPIFDEIHKKKRDATELAVLKAQHKLYQERLAADDKTDDDEEAAALRALEEVRAKRREKEAKANQEIAMREKGMKKLGWKSPTDEIA